MKRLTLLFVLIGLLSVACGGESALVEPVAEGEEVVAATAVTETTETPEPTEPPIEPTATAEPTPEPDPTATPMPEPTPTAATGPVKIAYLDAFELEDGQARLNWARLAVEDFNAAAGWNVELVEADTGFDVTTVRAGINPVVNDDDIYVAVGPPFANLLTYAIPTFEAVGLPHLILNGAEIVTPSTVATLFRLAPSDSLQAQTAAQFMVEELGATNVYVLVHAAGGLYFENLYAGLEQALTATGGTIVGREGIAGGGQDFSPLVDSIQTSGADVVFGAGGFSEQGGLLAQALAEAGIDVPLVGHYGWATTRFLPLAEGAYILSPVPSLHDTAPELAQRYEEEHGLFAVDGPAVYEAMTVALEATQRAAESGTFSRAAVADEMAATSMDSTVLARPLAFTADGELQDAQFYVLQVEDGVFRTVRP